MGEADGNRGMILCAGMSRGGGTLLYQLVAALMEWHGYRAAGMASHVRGRIVVKIEEARPGLVRLARNRLARVVTIHRDPRDVATSLLRWGQRRAAYKADGHCATWGNAVGRLPYILSWVSDWESVASHVSVYEECWPDGWGAELERIAADLSVECSREAAEQIARRYTVERNRRRMAALPAWMEPGRSMLTKEHIGPEGGRPGQWMEYLTVKQAREVEALAGEWMEEHGYRRLLDRAG